MKISSQRAKLLLTAAVGGLILLILLISYIILNRNGGDDVSVSDEDREVEETFEAAAEDPEIDSETEIIEQEATNDVFSVSIDADVSLPKANSLARAILIDTNGSEYLIYETYPLLEKSGTFSVSDVCEETCLLDGIVMKDIKIYTENDAAIDIKDVKTNTKSEKQATKVEKEAQKEKVLDEKVAKLSEEIKTNNLRWTAGKTSFASLSYTEKKDFFEAEVPNLQGAEFYKGGIFETVGIEEENESEPPSFRYLDSYMLEAVINFVNNLFGSTSSASSLNLAMVGNIRGASSSRYVDTWDWRSKHKANVAYTPYFDANPDSQETGNGWMTEIKDQRSCGSCWAFAATGATEALVNLYYNYHVDLDLSEQDALSCSGAGSCSGGWPGQTLNYYTTTGVVDESCFPYTATNNFCSNRCSTPTERVKIGGKISFTNKTNDNLKQLIIENGPISGGIYSWSHAMPLLGWDTDTDDSPIWLFKNSWGKDWGDGGYLHLKTPITNIGWTHALKLPITDTSSRTIKCFDADGDGYYNWGLSTEKPASCPPNIPDEKDCNDADFTVAVYNERYECVAAQNDAYPGATSYNFNLVPFARSSAAKEILIGNRGATDITIDTIGLADETYFSLNLSPSGAANPCTGTGTVIASGSSCVVEVTFSPQVVQSYSTTLDVTFVEGGVNSVTVPILGEGSSDPKTVCNYFGSSWVGEGNRCFELNQSECLQYNGEVNDCDSYCPPGQTCTQGCKESCVF